MRVLLEGLTQQIIPPCDDLYQELIAAIGKQQTLALVLAFAKFECFYCQRGFETCTSCEGAGHSPESSDPCSDCLGIGAMSCDFCGGSGWVTYNFVPTGLRPAVAVLRSRLATARLAELNGLALPRGSRSNLKNMRKGVVRILADIDRNLAALKNAIEMAGRFRKKHPQDRLFTNALFVRSSRTARAATAKAQRVLRLLATISRRIAATASTPGTRQFEEGRAAMFDAEAIRLSKAKHRRAMLFPWRAVKS